MTAGASLPGVGGPPGLPAPDGPPGAGTGPDPGPYRRLLANPGFLRVFAAGLGSVAGRAVSQVCLVWIVFAATGSPLDVGLLGAATLAGALGLSVFSGTWVDRYDRRRLMILSEFARALTVGLVVVDLAVRGFDLGALLAASFVLGAFSTLFAPAEQALLPTLVAPADVARANGMVRSSRSALEFVGVAAAGALLVAVGGVAGLAVDVGTLLVSGTLLLGLRVPPGAPGRGGPEGRRGGYLEDLRAGFRWLRAATGFLELTLSATFFNFCWTLIDTFLVVFAAEVLHGSALVYAALLAAVVVGSALGALLVGPTRGERWAGRAWVVPYGVASGGVALLLALVPTVPVALAALAAIGALSGYAGTAWLTAAQLLVPTRMQGRYFGIDNLGSIAILPAAQIGGAFLVAGLGVGPAYLVIAIVWIAAGIVFLVPRALWNLGYRP